MRWMALDHGTKNIGIAFSDELEILASPFEVWPNLGEATLARLVRLARDEGDHFLTFQRMLKKAANAAPGRPLNFRTAATTRTTGGIRGTRTTVGTTTVVAPALALRRAASSTFGSRAARRPIKAFRTFCNRCGRAPKPRASAARRSRPPAPG